MLLSRKNFGEESAMEPSSKSPRGERQKCFSGQPIPRPFNKYTQHTFLIYTGGKLYRPCPPTLGTYYRYIFHENIYTAKTCGGVGDKSPVSDIGVGRKPSLTTELEN